MSEIQIEVPPTKPDDPSNYYGQLRDEMLAFFPVKPNRVLDVGCARGQFGALLKRRWPNVEVWGIEPSVEAQVCAARVLDRALLGNFDESLTLPEDYFDTIVFNDSLEHMPDERMALRLATRHLCANGHVVASIPNVRCWSQVVQYVFDADWKYEAAGILDRTHLRFFTRRSIDRTFGEEGYRVTRLEGINPCWTGVKFKLLSKMFPKLMADMQFNQFAVVAAKHT